MNSRIKDYINNQLDGMIGDDDIIEDPEFLTLLNRGLSNTSGDKELEQWLQGESDNPFSQALELDLEDLRESLNSILNESSENLRDSDWLY